MVSPKIKLRQWAITQQALNVERERILYLNDKSKLPQNNPCLFTPTKVRCLRSFFINGKQIMPGQTLSIEYHLAMDMQSIKKVEILE